jgi:hypothetical protein
MGNILKKNIEKLYCPKWIFGICKGNIEEIIRTKTFNPDINWQRSKSKNIFYADPFILNTNGGNHKILIEEFSNLDLYGKISLMTFDQNFKLKSHKIVLDTKSHLSYPFVFNENSKTYIFPESAKNEKLSCYEFCHDTETVSLLKDIINLPLLDSSIIKHKNKYWIFGAMRNSIMSYELHIFYSDNILGPYTPHSANPVKNESDGVRQAGNFIIVNEVIYRPTQNCKNFYGESITINKITELSEIGFTEEPYMNIELNAENKKNHKMKTIHTLNVLNNIMVVDARISIFAPIKQILESIKNRTNKRWVTK